MLHKIELPMYPIDIYIHLGENLKETLNQFIDATTNIVCDDNWREADARVYRNIIHVETNCFALIIAFEKIPKGSLISHEIVHLIHRLYEHIGQSNFGDENNAYLFEFLFNEIETCIEQYKNISK